VLAARRYDAQAFPLDRYRAPALSRAGSLRTGGCVEALRRRSRGGGVAAAEGSIPRNF
jgi:hypothetical protein